MEILWPAAGICVIVVFVLYVLAQHWQRILRQQTWMIRRLANRVQVLEEVGDPQFRRRLGESAPVPLEQVFTFSFRLSDRFWRETLDVTEENLKFIHEFGSFVGSVKLERWRSHTVATITEVLPDRKTVGWQTRSLDFYPDAANGGEALALWELALSRPGLSAERPPTLELALRRNYLELCGHFIASAAGNGHRRGSGRDETVFFRVPLEPAELAEFRSHDPSSDASNGNGKIAADQFSTSAGSWQAFYSDWDEDLDIEWQLRLRDLSKKAEWERWKILESAAVPFMPGDE